MGFFDKIKSAIRKIKGKLIRFSILLVVIIWWVVMPFAVAKVKADIESGHTFLEGMNEGIWWSTFILEFGNGIRAPWTITAMCFQSQYIGTFFTTLKWTLIFFGFAVLVGIFKAMPKHEYQDIENGSSDWCEGGEQYKVLSKKTGIILAEKNYLPVDKRGNVNVLVVRRFWCW